MNTRDYADQATNDVVGARSNDFGQRESDLRRGPTGSETSFCIEFDGTGGSRVRWLDEEECIELGADLDLAGAEGGR